MRWLLLALLINLTPSLQLHARVVPDTSVADTLDVPPLVPFEQIVTTDVDTAQPSYVPTKSAGVAMLLSAVVPGAGQVYNESYWKAPIALGLGLYFTSQWLHYNRLTRDARERYQESLATIPGGDGLQLRLREFYKDQRDTFAWYFFILYMINVADAYVDASLYDFNVGDDLSLRLIPDPQGRFGVQLRF